MKKVLICLSCLILIISCRKDEIKIERTLGYSAIIEDSLIYYFLNNTLLKENDIYKYCNTVLNKKPFYTVNGESPFLKKIDTIKFFSVADKEFIKRQYDNSKYFSLNKNLLKNKIVVEIDTTLKTREERRVFYDNLLNKFRCYSSVSVPIFNSSKNIAIVECEYICGLMCAEGGTFIYRKNEKNVWEIIMVVDRWIS